MTRTRCKVRQLLRIHPTRSYLRVVTGVEVVAGIAIAATATTVTRATGAVAAQVREGKFTRSLASREQLLVASALHRETFNMNKRH